jgi:hypothetical protein
LTVRNEDSCTRVGGPLKGTKCLSFGPMAERWRNRSNDCATQIGYGKLTGLLVNSELGERRVLVYSALMAANCIRVVRFPVLPRKEGGLRLRNEYLLITRAQAG